MTGQKKRSLSLKERRAGPYGSARRSLGRRSAERERGSKVMLFLPPACGTGSIRAYTEAKTSFAHWATLSGYTVYT